MKRGQQMKIPTPGKQQWQHLIGAYNWVTGEVIYTLCKKKNTASFCKFLEHLMASAVTDKPIVYVLDNAPYHHSHISKAMIAYYEDRAWACWLPPYCSDLNPIERFWKYLKDKVCVNRLFAAISELLELVETTLRSQNDLNSGDRLLFQKTFCD
jgi:transposase